MSKAAVGYSVSFTALFRRLWKHITPTRRLQFAGLMLLMITTSVAELLSIGAVIPFLGVLTAPHVALTHYWTQKLIYVFGSGIEDHLVFALTCLFIASILLSGFLRILLLWTQTRLGHALGSDFSVTMYHRTLYQPYSVHLSRNSSEVIAGISNKAKTIVGSTLLPIMTIMSSAMLLGSILFILLHIEPVATLSAFGFVVALYVMIFVIMRQRLINISRVTSDGQTQLIKVLREGLGSIRDIIINRAQFNYWKAYKAVDTPLRRAVANAQIISISPRYLIESLGMSLIAVIAYFLYDTDGSGKGGAIPVLGAIAMGAQRMLPLLQQAYSSLTLIRSGQISLSDSLDLMDQPLEPDPVNSLTLPFERSIVFRNVTFKFSTDSPEVLHSLNVKISKGSRVGVVGRTGAGKSTFLDVLMGLLSPTKGELLIDGVVIDDRNRQGWLKHIAHVPQNIYLFDGTVEENIAFGELKENINRDRIRTAARGAHIADFIESLRLSYDSHVGERGVKLSGGQRQRIAIARALYRKADVVVFDEATSALDVETERQVMNEVDSLGIGCTTILVSHRLSALKDCDQIIEIDNGRIMRIGAYPDFIGS